MKTGQVAYKTAGDNLFLVAFGELADLAKSFATLDQYRNASLARLQDKGHITGKLVLSKELRICGHRAILSNLQGNNSAGAFVDVWSVDLWCHPMNRYYSVYGDFSNREEFPQILPTFSSFAQSLVCHGPKPGLPSQSWAWADLGFNTRSGVWFLSLFDYSGFIEDYQAPEIILKGDSGVQYQWPESGEKPMWHIRERIFSGEVGSIDYDEHGNLVVERAASTNAPSEEAPENFDSITYAYSLSTAMGFIEFRDGGKVVRRIDNRWIAVENLAHRTVGKFPNIRLMAKQEDIKNIIVTDTCIVIQGKTSS
jgi:hypothetical protein